MSLYDKVVQFVDKSFKGRKAHFQRTVFWLEKFLPNVTDAHRIAAYAHDIERAIKGEKDRDYLNTDILTRHQEEGAKIMQKFLTKQNADEKTIKTVENLISKHEVGGDEDQNALMDADSVSYFETNVEMFVRERAEKEGYEKIKAKLDWMFDRISLPERKEFARENYEKWSGELDKTKNETHS